MLRTDRSFLDGARQRPPPVNDLAGKTWKHERRRPAKAAGFGVTRRLARAGRAFDSRRQSSAPYNVNIVCEVIEGAGPNERRETRGREERLRGRGQLRGWTATPRDLIRAMPAKGDHPAGRFFYRAAIGHGPGSTGGTRYGHRAGAAAVGPRYRGRLRAVIVERMLRNEFRNGLQVVPGSSAVRARRSVPLLKVAER